jgi:hypothetical protein
MACYRLNTEDALAQADFLQKPDMVVLQALAIYISVLQSIGEGRSAWLLTGILVRAAVSIELHRDIEHSFPFTLLEKEQRRRLWWHICFIDSRSHVLHVFEFKVSEEMFNTKEPTNCDDGILSKGNSDVPPITAKWTDTTILVIHCEVWKLSRQFQKFISKQLSLSELEEMTKVINQTQARIEDTHLRHFDPNKPLQCFVATLTRLFFSRIDLILKLKQESLETQTTLFDDSEKFSHFYSAMSIVQYSCDLMTTHSWKNWTWQIQGSQPPRHALSIVLKHLASSTWTPISDGAWNSCQRCFEAFPDKPNLKLRKLFTAAWQNRGNGMNQQTSFVTATDAHEGLTLNMATLMNPLEQTSSSEIGSAWSTISYFPEMATELNDTLWLDDLSFYINWPGWDCNV